MEFKLFPSPSRNICTPFIYDGANNIFSRYSSSGSENGLITIELKSTSFNVVGCKAERVVGKRRPNRNMMLKYVGDRRSVARGFCDYVEKTYVIPTFCLSEEEAFVKTVIRQIIRAKQAKEMFSDFVHEFGFERSGVYGFPSLAELGTISIRELRKFGLGFRADRMHAGIRKFEEDKRKSLTEAGGIGPWSRSILIVEGNKDYSYYPFSDKSGSKIKKVCGIDVDRIARMDRQLAADLYVYGASYLESIQ